MEGRNTIRYLNRLVLGIKGDLRKKLTTLCLFIDFEKAFDSIWKKGLIVKLHKIGITGNILYLINDFLTNRKVTINVNGIKGAVRNSADVGLPQGSALSPILFRIYLLDFLSDLQNNNSVSLLKFADDGTVKVTGETTAQCLQNMQLVFHSVELWVKKWRMNINCDKNKTEMISFGTVEKNQDLIPKTFQLCGKYINLVSHTKVLGLVLDEHLNFKEHGKMVYKKLLGKWAEICKYSNRHWGLNQHVMVQIIKTIFHSSLFYAGHVWINKDSIAEINTLYYKILKSSVGAVFNVKKSTAEVILGLPPLDIINQINRVKHYLKINLNNLPGDRMKEMVNVELNSESARQGEIYHALRQVFKFLKWKNTYHSEEINTADRRIINSSDISEFTKLSRNTCKYSKTTINQYIEQLWSKKLENEFLQEGHSSIPKATI